MNKKDIKKLNQLNHQFYKKTAADFSDSRNYYWQGWKEILKFFKGGRVLDIACGNGRFALFLEEKSKKNFDYYGLDNSEELLKIARKKVKAKFKNFDLIKNYLKDSKIKYTIDGKFDLIVSFGLTHHLALQELRKEFIKSLEEIVNDDGLVFISNWQFADDENRFKKNILTLKKINKNKEINIWQKFNLKKLLNNLEENDYILDWRRGESKNKAFRYCHFINDKEMKDLIKETSFKIEKSFFDDGKSEKLNHYYILKKTFKK